MSDRSGGQRTKLRPATNADAERVKELVFAVLREYGLLPDPGGTDADLQDLDKTYREPGGAFDVLETGDGTLVGCVGLYPADSNTCELRKMYLAPGQRGRGLGKRLLEHALERSRELGFRRVTLETASVLTEAISLYTSYGFRPFRAEYLSQRCDQAYVLDL